MQNQEELIADDASDASEAESDNTSGHTVDPKEINVRYLTT